MAQQSLPGTDAARHGSGDTDLAVMIAAHDAFRRDLVSLAHAASRTRPADPVKRASISAGWEMFKTQLHMHHTSEDQLIWPNLAEKLSHSDAALSVLEAMEVEHGHIDPLLAAVDRAFADPESDRLADVTDALASDLTAHLNHEERDALPLIGVALTTKEWKAVTAQIGKQAGLSAGGAFFGWMLNNAPEDSKRAVLGSVPPPVRLLYRAIWKPKYDKTPRW
jgi:iron-sulfur cluster repair protein YtfE (RIC family)